MKATLRVINQMQADEVISKYAIGEAVGATFYLEPSATVDIHVFVSLPHALGGSRISLQPIYDYLTARNCKVHGEYIIIEGWQVQFLSPSDRLAEEALDEAIQTEVNGLPTRVMTAEHLVALALQVGRAKDFSRILQFVEAGVLDAAGLEQILSRHDLLAKWEQFGDKFLRNR